MWIFNQTSPATRISLVYITTGALTVIWTSVWYAYLYRNPPEGHGVFYVIAGLLISGITLLGIGLGLGWIGRASRPADDVAAHTPEGPAVVAMTPAAATPIVANPPAPAASTPPAPLPPPGAQSAR
jgi:hypothetical protein